MTATLDPQLKNGSTSKPVQPLAAQPVRVRPAGPPALLIEDVSKRFVIGRKRKSVTAIQPVLAGNPGDGISNHRRP